MSSATTDSSAASTASSLAMLMRALKLPTFARYGEEIAQKAEREGWTFGQYLHHLAELEVHERRRRRTERYLKDSDLLPEKTLSTEATSFQGCPGTESICGNGCADLQTDRDNCGSCGKVCANGTACGGGKCVDPAAACNSCIVATKTGACKTSFDTCKADATCGPLWTCVEGCQDNTCTQACATQYPTGQTKAQAFLSCARDACANVCD